MLQLTAVIEMHAEDCSHCPGDGCPVRVRSRDWSLSGVTRGHRRKDWAHLETGQLRSSPDEKRPTGPHSEHREEPATHFHPVIPTTQYQLDLCIREYNHEKWKHKPDRVRFVPKIIVTESAAKVIEERRRIFNLEGYDPPFDMR
jgi:hypothetical protein